MLGTSLGNYRVVQQLSEGGMGVVYIGHHEALGRRVVVKVLQPELSNDADMVQRFFNEARAATAIRSPGIVQVFDFGFTPDRRAYFVMELLEGESLAARLKRGLHDPAECCRLGRQVANVLHAAHAAGITHRDLKPPNLFLVPDPEVAGGERVKVLDFGIAKLAGEAHSAGVQTRTGLIMGTPYYMSPEQCRSASAADARSDIYSLGCILFQMACGRPPFVFAGVGDIVAAHLHEPPPAPHQLAPGVPPGLSALISAMLAKSPDARPQTMAAVGQALDDLLRTLDPAAAGPSRRPSSQPSPQLPGAAPSASPPHAPAHAAALAHAPPGLPASAYPAGWAPAHPAPLPIAPPAALAGADLAPRGVAHPPLLAVAQPPPLGSAHPLGIPIAQPIRLPRPAIPDFSSIATTLRQLSGSFTIRRERVRRWTFLFGALVIAGAITAIAIVLGNAPAGPQERTVPYSKIVGSAAAGAHTAAEPATAAPGTAVAPDASDRPAPTEAASPQAMGTPATGTPATGTQATGTQAAVIPGAPSTRAAGASSMVTSAEAVAAECQRDLHDRRWPDLAQCADKLKPLDARRAAELAMHATKELDSAPHVAAAHAALQDGNLKRARAEIDQLWPGSVEYDDLKHAYDDAEAQKIVALAAQLQLAAAKDTTCSEYSQLLATYRASDPARVAQEAARRTPCKAATPKCDADALEARARALVNKNQYDDALDAYDAAYACRPAPTLLQRAFVVACNRGYKAEARSYWKRLSPALRALSIGVCVTSGITESMLNAR